MLFLSRFAVRKFKTLQTAYITGVHHLTYPFAKAKPLCFADYLIAHVTAFYVDWSLRIFLNTARLNRLLALNVLHLVIIRRLMPRIEIVVGRERVGLKSLIRRHTLFDVLLIARRILRIAIIILRSTHTVNILSALRSCSVVLHPLVDYVELAIGVYAEYLALYLSYLLCIGILFYVVAGIDISVVSLYLVSYLLRIHDKLRVVLRSISALIIIFCKIYLIVSALI